MPTAKKPHDHQTKKAPYPVEIHGKTHLLAVPKVGTMRRIRKLDAMDLMFTLFEECGDEAFLEALDGLQSDELQPIFSDWMGTFGGGDAGKSGGSSS